MAIPLIFWLDIILYVLSFSCLPLVYCLPHCNKDLRCFVIKESTSLDIIAFSQTSERLMLLHSFMPISILERYNGSQRALLQW